MQKKNWKRNIILYLTSQTISLFGSMLVQYAMSWHIVLETQSATMMTVSILCGFLPAFFVSPFAGVWADRYNRKLLIILSDAIIALATLFVAAAFMYGYREIWLIFVVMAVRGIGQGVQQPAVGAMIPRLVPEDKLMKINAANSTVQSIMMLASPVLAASLLAVASIESIFFIDVITAAIAILILALFLRVDSDEQSEKVRQGGYFEDFISGLKYIRRHSFVKQLFVFCIVFYLMAGPSAFLSPLQVTRLFGSDTMRLSSIEAAFSAGMIAGGILMMLWGGFKNRHSSLTLGLFAYAAGTMILGLLPLFWVYIAVMFILGVSMPVFNTPFMVIMQEKIEPEYLGRVLGFLGMLSSIGMPMGMLVFGPLADIIDLNLIFIGTGGVMLISSIVLRFNKSLIEAGKPLTTENKGVRSNPVSE